MDGPSFGQPMAGVVRLAVFGLACLFALILAGVGFGVWMLCRWLCGG